MNILKNKNCNIKINDDNSNIVYVKTENGIFKCYKSETMHKPIYHPVNSNGYIDYGDVIKVLTIDDLFEENQKYKEVIDKANKWVRDYMDEWDMNDEVWQDLNDLLILLEEVEHD